MTWLIIKHRLTPPMRPHTNGMVERFNGRIGDVLQSHRFRSGGDLEQTILRYVRLYNGQLPQSALKGRTPLAALKEWRREKQELFKKRPYDHAGSDTYDLASDPLGDLGNFDIDATRRVEAQLFQASTVAANGLVLRDSASLSSVADAGPRIGMETAEIEKILGQAIRLYEDLPNIDARNEAYQAGLRDAQMLMERVRSPAAGA